MSRDRFSPYEFALIIGIAFGWPILGSLMALSSGHAGESGTWEAFGPSQLYGAVVNELICLPILAVILHARGWSSRDFPMGIGKATTLLGVGIARFVPAWIR